MVNLVRGNKNLLPLCVSEGQGGQGGQTKKNKVQGKSGQRTDVGPWELSNVPHVGPYNSS